MEYNPTILKCRELEQYLSAFLADEPKTEEKLIQAVLQIKEFADSTENSRLWNDVYNNQNTFYLSQYSFIKSLYHKLFLFIDIPFIYQNNDLCISVIKALRNLTRFNKIKMEFSDWGSLFNVVYLCNSSGSVDIINTLCSDIIYNVTLTLNGSIYRSFVEQSGIDFMIYMIEKNWHIPYVLDSFCNVAAHIAYEMSKEIQVDTRLVHYILSIMSRNALDKAIQLASFRFLQKFSVQNRPNKILIHQLGGYFLICLALHNFVQDAEIVCEGLDLLNNLYRNKTIVSMSVNKFNAPDYATAIIGDTIFGLKFVRELFNRSLVQAHQQTLVDESSISPEQKKLMIYHKNILQLLFDIIGRLGQWEEFVERFVRDDVEYVALPAQISVGPDMAPSDDTYDAVLLRSNIIENRKAERHHNTVFRDFVNNYKYDTPESNPYQSRKRSIKTPSYGFTSVQPIAQPLTLNNAVPFLDNGDDLPPSEGFQMFAPPIGQGSAAAASNAPPLTLNFGQGSAAAASNAPPLTLNFGQGSAAAASNAPPLTLNFGQGSAAAASNAPPLTLNFGQGSAAAASDVPPLVQSQVPIMFQFTPQLGQGNAAVFQAPPIVPLPNEFAAPPIVTFPNALLAPPIVPILDDEPINQNVEVLYIPYRPFLMASHLDELIFIVPSMTDNSLDRIHLYSRKSIPEIVFSNSLLDELKQFIPKIGENPSSELWENVTITFARLHPTLLFYVVMNTNLVRKILLYTNSYEKLVLKEISNNFPWKKLDIPTESENKGYSIQNRDMKLVALNRIKQLQGHQRQEPVRERSTLDKIIGLLQEDGVDVHSHTINKMFHLAEGVSITPYLLMNNTLSRELDIEQSFYELFIDKDVARFLICCGVYIEEGMYTEQNLPQSYHILSFPEYDLLRELYLLVQYECRTLLNFALREFDNDTKQMILRQIEQKRVQVIQRVDVERNQTYNPWFL